MNIIVQEENEGIYDMLTSDILEEEKNINHRAIRGNDCEQHSHLS